MDKRGSTSIKRRKLNYFNLLQELDKLSKLINNVNEYRDDVKVDIIFNNLAVNIEHVCEPTVAHRSAMFLVTILNTLIHIATVDKFDYIISLTSFQLLFQELKYLIMKKNVCTTKRSPYASNIRASMFMNLVKGDLAQKCFHRLLSTDTSSITGNILYKLYMSPY